MRSSTIFFCTLLAAAVARRACAIAQQPPTDASASSPRSVLVITLDTTRRDYVGFMGKRPSPTPVLDALAQSSLVFEDALTTVPLTLPAHTSLFTGLYPTKHGVRDNSLYRVPSHVRTLAEMLHDHGYVARAAVASFVLDPAFGLEQGFDRYRAPPRVLPHGGQYIFRELDARQLVDRAIEDLKELAPSAGSVRPPFFYWLHLFDPHSPYASPEAQPLPPEIKSNELLTRKTRYAEEIEFADRQLGRLFDALRSMQLFDELVIVVTSDHGESLQDAREESHGHFLFDPTVRVPLLMRVPGLAARRVAVPASHVDVVPTLLSRLGLDGSGEQFDGIDLTPWIEDPARPPPDRALMLETMCNWNTFGWAPLVGCTREALKYVRSASESLFDLAADPFETTNLFTREDPRAVGLARRVDAHVASASPPAEATTGITEADRAALRAMGYAGGSAADVPSDWASLPDPMAKAESIVRYNAAWTANLKGNASRAIELLRSLVADEPKSPAVREQLGLILFNSGLDHLDEAASELDETLKLDPRRGRSWYMRATCAGIQAERERAAARSLRQEGRSDEARPHAEAERKALELAELAAKKALECDPSYPEAMQLLSRLLVDRAETLGRRGKPDLAREKLAEALAIVERLIVALPPTSPEWAEAVTARERMKAQLGKLEAPR